MTVKGHVPILRALCLCFVGIYLGLQGDALVRGSGERSAQAAIRAKLELARAERARVDEKIRRLESQLLDGGSASVPSDFDAEDVMETLQDQLLKGLGGTFEASIRQSAKKALTRGPQTDESGKGCDWIAGIRLAWTSPPTVREVKEHVQTYFEEPIRPGDLLMQIDGESIDGLGRKDILNRLRKFVGSLSLTPGSRIQQVRKSAEAALKKGPEKDDEYQEGQNWIWGILFAWTSPPVVREVKPEVQKHFPHEVLPGDTLREVDDNDISGLSRKQILNLLSKYEGSIGFKRANDMNVCQSAQAALENGPEEDAESGKKCNWVGGILLAWTSPPVVLDVKPHVQKHFPRPISPGDILWQVDGKNVVNLNREEILDFFRHFKGSLGFRGSSDMDSDVRKSARAALENGPEEDAKSGKRCNWIGGILLEWTSPPVVLDVKPHVQKHFPRPISLGDVLRQVDGKNVLNLNREEILDLFRDFKGSLGFRGGIATEVRKSAQAALENGPEEDAESGKRCNWIGGILLAWTSPPVVLDVKPHVHKFFRRPISPGDVLMSINDRQVLHMSRMEILQALVQLNGELGFASKDAFGMGLAELLRRLADL